LKVFLHPHPSQLPSEPFSLEVAVRIKPDGINLHYRLTGNLSLIRIPPASAPERRDGLWQHTCFEAFVQPESRAHYLELNFSPSSEWAAYHFGKYREGMAELNIPAPAIEVKGTENMIELRAETSLPPEWITGRLGLSAVIEEASGRKSYWALVHRPGDKPDFHHPDCFALDLSPASGA
jgi:hypothetical protein